MNRSLMPIDFHEFYAIQQSIQQRKPINHYEDVPSSKRYLNRFWLIGPCKTEWTQTKDQEALGELWQHSISKILIEFSKRPGVIHTPMTIELLLDAVSECLLEPLNISLIKSYTSLGFRHIKWCVDTLTSLGVLYKVPAFKPVSCISSMPWPSRGIHQAPKILFRQTGILHYIHGIKSTTDLRNSSIAGKSWINMVLASYLTFCAPSIHVSYYKSYNGSHIDAILDSPSGERWGINLDYCRGFLRFRRHYYRTMLTVNPDRMFYVFPSVNPKMPSQTHVKALRRGVEVVDYRKMGHLIMNFR
jgi:predicted AAA+ superfamily ATPase